MITTDVSLEADTAYTVAAVGLENTAAQVFADDLSAPPSGKVGVRVIHLSPDAPSANVEVVDGPTLVEHLGFLEASNYLTVDAGTYNLRVVANSDNAAFIQLPNTEFKTSMIYDVIAHGRLSTIKVAVGTFTPSAQQQTDAEASPRAVPAQAVLSDTGTSAWEPLGLVGLGLLSLIGGYMLRRRIIS